MIVDGPVPRELARRGATSLGGKVATLLLQTAHLAVLARGLTESSFGSFAAAMALLVILGGLAEFGIVHAAVLALGDGEPEGRVVRAARRLSTRLVATSATVAVLIAIAVFDRDAQTGVILLLPWLVLSRLDSAYVAVHQFHVRTGRLAAGDVISRAALLLAAVPVLVAGGQWTTTQQLAVVAAGFAVSELVSLAILVPGVADLREGSVALGSSLVRRALPLGLTSATGLVHARSDQVVLSALGRQAGLGAYALAARVNEAMLALTNAAGAVSFPAIVRAEGAARAAQARRFIRWAGVGALISGAAVFILAPTIVDVVGGDRYAEAAHLTRLLVPALVAGMVNLPIAQLAIASGATPQLLRLAGGAVVANLALTGALVWPLDAAGAAVATSITETAVLLIGARVVHNLVPGAVPWRVVVAVPALLTAALWSGLVLWRGDRPVVAAALVVAAICAARPWRDRAPDPGERQLTAAVGR